MAQHYGPHIVTDGLKLLLDPKDEICNGGKSVMTDLSGNLNSGSIHSGIGVSFNGGSDHYINITGSTQAIHDDITLLGTGGEFAMTAWIYPTSDSGEQYIYSATKIGVNYGGGWQLQVTGKGSGEWELSMGNTLGTTASAGSTYGFWGSTGPRFPINKWYHVAQTRESDGWHCLWVNGTRYGWDSGIRNDNDSRQLTLNEDWPGKPGEPLWVGGWSNGGYNFTGYMSDLRIYKGTGTSGIIKDLYDNPNKVLSGNVSGSQLKLWLPLIEGSGTSVLDNSLNSSTATLMNSPTWVSGSATIPQTATGFEYSSSLVTNPNEGWFDLNPSGSYQGAEYILCQDIDELDGVTAITYECWANINSRPDDWYFLIKKHAGMGIYRNPSSLYGGSDPYMEMWVSSGKSSQSRGNVIKNNTWHHFVGVFDGTNNILTYIDGVDSVGSRTAGPSTTTNDSSVVYIGRETATGPNQLHGKISSVKIYDKALSSKEVLQNYNAQRGRFGV